ncbi:MAG TPA: DUF2202 domain-containing protein [Pseudomonadales bacterium]
MKTKTLMTFTLAFFMAFAGHALAARGGNKGAGGGGGDSSTVLTAEEVASLQFMREEEKLARDVYLTLDQYWGTQTQVFALIAVSEESHTSAIEFLLEKYGVEDPVISDDIGVFTDQELQALYDTLVEQGIQSLEAGLYVGGLIEEKDMMDILASIEATDERAMILAYSNLLDGSKDHLRAFVRVIESLGLVYEAQVLDADEVQFILESEE